MTAGIVLAVTLLVPLAFVPTPTLSVRSASGAIDHCWRAGMGDEVTLVFTNSLYGGEVRERYRVEREALVRTGFETERAAAAEYYAWTAPVTPIANGYRVELPTASFAEVTIRIDATGKYRLRVDGAETSLSDGIGEATAATMTVRTQPLLAALFRCRD